MKSKHEANWYDKIFQENLEAVTMAIIEKVLGIQVAQVKKVDANLPKTIERKPDQLLHIVDTSGQIFILHLEFQVIDESDMVYRMLEYRALLSRKYKLPVQQHLIFLSDERPTMQTHLQESYLSFGFHLVWLAEVDYRLFLSSHRADEVVFAVLGNFGTDTPYQAAIHIVERLSQTASGSLDLQKYFEQLRVLANLRKLKPFIEQVMEALSKYIKPEDDFLYQKGKQEGKLEGKQEGKLEETKHKQEEIKAMIRRFLQEGLLTVPQIAFGIGVSEAFVEQIRKEMN